MTSILLRMFLKNRENMEDPAVRGAVGKLAGWTGIVCNCLLFLGKLLAGLLAGSVSVIADAVNNLSDAASSVVTLLGFRLAQRPADADHPYGHGRYEYLSALVIAVLIMLMGAGLAQSSIGKILHPQDVSFSGVTALILLGSVAVKLWMGHFFGALGKKIRSASLQAAAADSRGDVLSTAAVLLGWLAGYVFRVNLDGIAGLAVAVFILYSGFSIAGQTVSSLLGPKADEELVAKITRLILANEKVLGVHDLLVHDYGPGQCFASAHVELSAREEPLACHDMIDAMESEVLSKLNVHLVIHYDPVTEDDAQWEQMRQAVCRIVQDIDPRLSIHDFRMVPGGGQTKLVFDLAVPYSMGGLHLQLQQQIDEALLSQGMQYSTEIRFDEKE